MYLYRITYELIKDVVEERAQDIPVREEDKSFITRFYMYAFVGVMLDWIKEGMKESPEELSEKVGTIMFGNIDSSLQKFRSDRTYHNR